MEDYWFLLTILITLSIGIVAFINKIFAEKKYNVQLTALILYAMMFFISLCVGLLLWFSSLSELGILNTFLCILWWVQFYVYSLIMMNALKYLPTSTYFITVRLSSSFLLLWVWILFFWDDISLKELLGFVLWIVAMCLLFEKQNSPKKDLKTWLLFILLWIFTLAFGHSITKILSFEIEHVPLLLSIAFASAFFPALIVGYTHIRTNLYQLRDICRINIIQTGFYFFYFYALFYVYNLGDLGISYKIQSYSPFIPIILAAIIYREKISLKQWIWIVITSLSLYFFT